MCELELENEDKLLKKIGLELMFLTPEKYSSTYGITYVELAKLVEIPVDTVKKKAPEKRFLINKSFLP